MYTTPYEPMSEKELEKYNVLAAWKADLYSHREIKNCERDGYNYAIQWYLGWATGQHLEPGRESARRFWTEIVRSSDREDWQIRQWTLALRWYLEWLERIQSEGVPCKEGVTSEKG